MRAKSKSILKLLTAAALPAAALLALVPLAALQSRSAAPTAAAGTTATAQKRAAIAPANQAAAEQGFDAFLAASATGLGGSSYNAAVALYAAIGQTVTPAQAAALNLNLTRDLLTKLSVQDSNSALTGGWTLNLATSNFDGLSLGLLAFLQYFPNLTGVNLVAQATATAPNTAAFRINSLADLAWLGQVKGLRTLRIANEAGLNPTQFDAAGLSLLANLPLTSVDFTRFLSQAAGQTASRPIFAALNLSLPWYLTMPYAMTIRMPANYAIAANAALYRIDTRQGLSTDVVKAIGPALPNPSAAFRSVTLDGSTYEAVLSNSVLIWPFNADFFRMFQYANAAGNYFATSAADRFTVTRKVPTEAETALYDNFMKESNRTNVFLPQPLSESATTNLQALEETVLVDGVRTPRVLVNGTLYWAFNQRLARFRDDDQKKFWTSYERISPDDLDPANRDKVQSITRNVAEAQQDRSSSEVTAIAPPTSATQEFFLNNQRVIALLNVRTGGFFWDFARQGLSPELVRFYSRTTQRAYSSPSNLVAAAGSLPGFSYAAYSSARITAFDSVPTDTDPSHLPSDIVGTENVAAYLARRQNATVSIDGASYGYVLRNGQLYVNYDTSMINFVAIVGTSRFYYTRANAIPAAQVSIAQLLPSIPSRTIPNPQAIVRPNLAVTPAVDRLLLNRTESVGYGINNGVLYWRFFGSSANGLADIKYVDASGGYYTNALFELTADTIVSNGLTEVVPAANDENTAGVLGSSTLLSQTLDEKSYQLVTEHAKITLDGRRVYSRKIAHSRVYWVDDNGLPAGDLSNITLQEFEGSAGDLQESAYFYTSVLAAQSTSASFPEKVRQISPPPAQFLVGTLEPVMVGDPKRETDELLVYVAGEPIYIRATASSDPLIPFAWEDREKVRMIKYASLQPDGTYVYFTNLQPDSWQRPGVTMTDVSDAVAVVSEASALRESRNQDNIYEIATVKYALIGVFSAVFATGTALFL